MGRKRLPPDLSTSSRPHTEVRPPELPGKRRKRTFDTEDLATDKLHEEHADPSDQATTKETKAAIEFQNYVWDLWLSNKESSKTVQALSQKSKVAGAKGVDRLASIGTHGKHPKNFSRDLKTQAKTKRSGPPLYYADIPCWSEDTAKCEMWSIPFLLPAEVIYKMLTQGAISLALLCCVIADTAMAGIKEAVCGRLQIADPSKHVLWGLHSDGVPCQKSGATIEVQSWNYPNLPQCGRNLWNVLEKRWFCKCGCKGRHTLDAILEVLVWHAQAAWLGIFPLQRHDKQPWRKSDSWRASLKGAALGFTASVVQMRCDWMAIKQIWSFGGWNAKRMCFKCRATQPNGEAPYTDVSMSALWRKMPLTVQAFMAELRDKGIDLSPLMSLPGFLLEYLVIDVLHAADLGTSADVTGSFLFEMVNYGRGFLSGTTKEKRVQDLWSRIRKLYKQFGTPNRLQALTVQMICKSKHASKPKLRAKAAEMRHLIPCVVQLAKDFNDHMATARSKTILALFSRLLDFYMSIGLDDFDPEVTADIIQDFCLLYKSLAVAQTGPACWYLKPKLHLLQELSLQVHTVGDPANYWTYKDEDFVGIIARVAASRGGPRQPNVVPENVFLRYCAS